WEHGVSVQYKLRKLAQFTIGVKNLFDEKPPGFSDSQDPFGQFFRIANYFGGGAYDYLGRSVFMELTAQFGGSSGASAPPPPAILPPPLPATHTCPDGSVVAADASCPVAAPPPPPPPPPATAPERG